MTLAVISNDARSFGRLLSSSPPDPWAWRWFQELLRFSTRIRNSSRDLRGARNHLQVRGSGRDQDRSLANDLALLKIMARALVKDFQGNPEIHRRIKKITEKNRKFKKRELDIEH